MHINNYMTNNDIEVVDSGIDFATTRVEFSEKLTNYYGYFHGGLYFSMADSLQELRLVAMDRIM
ncbi:hypothetical protein MGH68_10480 [Erysipelothrix sp. D19-032]